MTLPFPLTARHVRDALKAGRPENAERYLQPYLDPPHPSAVPLLKEVARSFAARGRQNLLAGRIDQGWDDLYAAETLNTGEPTVSELRIDLTKAALAGCRAALDAGDPVELLRKAKALRDHRCNHPQLELLTDAGQSWVLAKEFADRGEFALAKHAVDGVRRKMGFLPLGVEKFSDVLAKRSDLFAAAFARLTAAVDRKDWPAALTSAEEAVAAAPTHPDAKRLQQTVWTTVRHAANPDRPTTPMSQPSRGSAVPRDPAALAAATGGTVTAGLSSVANPGLPKRFFLWVDGIGGYLVCLAARVTVGQAAGDTPADVPVYADLARVHAEITRDAEGYLLASARGVQVNGQPADRKVLQPGDRVTVGSTCQFVFHQPVPLVPTAVLELVSGHRFQVAVDAVILMAETLILGPGPDAHVILPEADQNVILYRAKDGLGVRYDGDYVVGGQAAKGRTALPMPGGVTADAINFTVEPAGKK
ncbi:MAG TPA: FHA domain-containing protein [Fimbriiglobus sp.]|jgi:hypothetical protein